MRLSFSHHSTGSGEKAITYILAKKDHKGVVRARVDVLRGNPAEVARLIDSLSTVRRYTSGLTRWHLDDRPTPDEIDAYLNEFERVAFAGLNHTQFTYTAVLHEEPDGSVHIHTIAPRVELQSGKSMNIAPPGWEQTFDPLRDKWNYAKGWARPDDPERAKLVTAPKTTGKSLAWKEGRDPRQEITDWLAGKIKDGLVHNRDDVLEKLAPLGDITRAGQDYISVKLKGADKAIRLKGSIYGHDFNAAAFLEAEKASGIRPGRRAEPDLDASKAASDRLKLAVRSRTAYNQGRYGSAAPTPRGAKHQTLQSPPELTQIGATEIGVEDLQEDQVADVVAIEQRLPVVRVDGGTRAELANDPQRAIESPASVGGPADQLQAIKQSVLQQSGRQETVHIQPLTGVDHGNQDESSRAGTPHDGIGAEITRLLEAAYSAARTASDAVSKCLAGAGVSKRAGIDYVGRASADLGRTATQSIDTDRAVDQACQAINRSIPRVKALAEDELEKFKREISLVDLAQNEFGYEYIQKESSKVYFVLRKDNEKIVVTRDQEDGHDVYCNTGDKADCGSIIDFVKNRLDDKNAKLVRVRQALRPWAPGAKKPAANKPAAPPVRPVAVERDRTAIVAAWKSMQPYQGSYLTEERKLDPAIIQAFGVRQDEHGNACFVHRKPGEGVTGHEYKNAPLPGENKTFTGFSGGGKKALFTGRLDDLPVSQLVVVEAAIDVLSYAQMHHKPGTLYISVAGSMSHEQANQLQARIAGHPTATLVIATDNDLTDKEGQSLALDDRPGEKLAKAIAAMAPQGMTIKRHTPQAKDWNADLQAMAKQDEEKQSRKLKRKTDASKNQPGW